MPRSSTDFQQKSFRIRHDDDDDKFLSRLLSKETSKSNSSFRVYYGEVSSAVPFMWETRPGTPKHTAFSDNINCKTPPLTPPPSCHTNVNHNLNSSSSSSSKKQYYHYYYYRSKLQPLQTLLRRMNPRKANLASSSNSSSSPSLSNSHLSWPSSSSSNSSFCDPMLTISDPNDHDHMIHDINRRRRRFSSWGSSNFDHACKEMDINANRGGKACPSSLSSRNIGKDTYSTGERAHQAGASVLILKKAFLSITGRGSA